MYLFSIASAAFHLDTSFIGSDRALQSLPLNLGILHLSLYSI